MFVKICGITNEDDALLAVAMGADAVGFIFAPSPRQVTHQTAFDITRRLPPEILTVGVFRDDAPSRVLDIAGRAGVKAIQLHGHESPEDAHAIARQFPRVYKAFSAGSDAVRRAREYPGDIVMVDSPSGGGSGDVFDWGLIDDVPEGLRILLAGGLHPDNVALAVAKVRPWGVDVNTGVEASHGRKDPMKVKSFIAAARAADPGPYLGPDDFPYDWEDE